jgi:hypothetical protein
MAMARQGVLDELPRHQLLQHPSKPMTRLVIIHIEVFHRPGFGDRTPQSNWTFRVDLLHL